MAYPSSFSTLVDQQLLGNQTVNVYSSLAALALEQSIVQVGMLAAVTSPPMLLVAVATAPASYLAKSTSSTGNAGGGGTVYWVPVDASLISSNATPFLCRLSPLSITAYTGSGTGQLTITTAAVWTIDGVTAALGDQIFLQPGLTNLTAKDSGPWTITTLGTASVSTVLTRPYWFAHANTFQSGNRITVGGEGTFLNNTVWRATVKAAVIDTTDPGFYVEEFIFQRKLSAGTLALAAGQPTLSATSATCPVGILSQSQSTATCSLAIPSGTLTGTVSYGPANASSAAAFVTLGYVGTSAMAIFALATAMTTQTSDASTLQVAVSNFG